MLRISHVAILASLLSGAALNVRAQNPPQKPATPAAAPTTEPATEPTTGPATIPAAKDQPPIRRARKVITDDDINGIGSIYKASGPGPDLSYIDDCDRSCFEVIRTSAHINSTGVEWKRDVLDAIDRVRADGAWQGVLRDFGGVRGEFCTLEWEKSQELAKNGDPRNVTPAEISIDEKYARKFKNAQADLLGMYDREQAAKQSHGMNALELAFMDYQVSRIVNAPCPPRAIYYPRSPDPADDP